ncbi:MAG TPA: methyltransferase domain-containing protein [Gammaproteobacteria bacterium]|nr:methyltransferase domain-containing protein [Gammaproteobacteria bacterium]
MTATDFDPQEIKRRQAEDWDAVSAGWEKWWDTLEAGAREVSARLIELAGLEPGHRVLDIATGIGEPALSAARAVAPGGRVVATDQAAGMLAAAERRARAAGVDNIEFRRVDGELLYEVNEQFDAALCRWGLMFFPMLDLALRNIHQRLDNGGRLAAAVWAEPEKVPSISVSMNAVREVLDLPPPAPGTPTPFSLANRDALQQAFMAAGFSNVRCEIVTVRFALPSPEDYTAFTRDISAPVAALCADLDEARRQAVWDAITEAARAYVTEDGGIAMENEAICIVGERC